MSAGTGSVTTTWVAGALAVGSFWKFTMYGNAD